MNTIVTITGPSCAGKSTLASYLSQHGIPEVQSFTTRQPREGESRSGSYRFVTQEWVDGLQDEYVIEKVVFNGHTYGNTVDQMRAAWREGKGLATVVVEPEGVKHWAAAAKSLGFHHYSIYLSQRQHVLLRRFTDRFAKNPKANTEYEMKRLVNMIQVEEPTWRKAFDYDLIVDGLGEVPHFGAVNEVMILGFLKLSFQHPEIA